VSPRDFDAHVVQVRLSQMQALLDDLAAVGEVPVARLEDDRMLRHGVERILTQLVELAVSVNSHISATQLGSVAEDYRSSFALARRAGLIDQDLAERLQRSAGLRNILVHEYVGTDLGVVAASIGDALTDYGAYVRSAARWLQARGLE
jgi:uncharacterized protein YutE (UPF0331/DUF86 family)